MKVVFLTLLFISGIVLSRIIDNMDNEDEDSNQDHEAEAKNEQKSNAKKMQDTILTEQ